MATYFTGFSEYTTGVQPSDWTERWVTNGNWTVVADATATGGKVLRSPDKGATDTRNALTWDAIDADALRDDVDVLMRVRFTDTLADSDILAVVRASGAGGAETAYRLGPRPAFTQYHNALYNGGAATNLTAITQSYTQNTWYWVRARVRGSTLQLKLWADGGSEPDWGITEANAVITAAGWIGVMSFYTGQCDVDVFAVGTGTDDATTAQSRKITITDLKAPNDANSTVANATGVQVKLWISTDSNDPVDTGAPDVLFSGSDAADIISGTMELIFDSSADIGASVLGVAKWSDSNETYFFPIDTIVTEDSSGP